MPSSVVNVTHGYVTMNVTDSPASNGVSVGVGGGNPGAGTSSMAAGGNGNQGSTGPVMPNPPSGSHHPTMPAAASASSTSNPGSHLWSRTQLLEPEYLNQLHQIYGEHFPIEARHHLAGWLEQSFGLDSCSPDMEPGNPEHCKHAHSLVLSMVNQLQEKANEAPDFLSKNKLEQIVDNLKVSQIEIL